MSATWLGCGMGPRSMAKPIMGMPSWEAALQQGLLGVPGSVISPGTPIASEWVDRAVGPLAPAIAGALKIAAGSGGGKGTAAGSRQHRLPLTLPPVCHGLTGLDVANQAISLCPCHGTLGCLTVAYRDVSLVASLWHIGASLEPTVLAYGDGTPGRADVAGW